MIAIEVTGSISAREFTSSVHEAILCVERAIHRLKKEGYRIFRISDFTWECDGRLDDSIHIEITKTY